MKPTIPIQKARFKNKFLRKHSSLIHKPDADKIQGHSGILISVAQGQEIRALTQCTTCIKKFTQESVATDTGCAGLLFIKLATPQEIVDEIFNQLPIKELTLCNRFIPITHTCEVEVNDIKATAEHLIKSSELSNKSIAVVVELRNNTRITRSAIKEIFFELLDTVDGARIDLKNPDFVLFASVFKSVVGMGCLKDYYGSKKYNLHEIAKVRKDRDI